MTLKTKSSTYFRAMSALDYLGQPIIATEFVNNNPRLVNVVSHLRDDLYLAWYAGGRYHIRNLDGLYIREKHVN